MVYSRKTQLSQDANGVFVFLKTNKMFPRLKQMVQWYVFIESTSLTSELVFSRTGHVVTKSLARFWDKSLEVLIELQPWKWFSSR